MQRALQAVESPNRRKLPATRALDGMLKERRKRSPPPIQVHDSPSLSTSARSCRKRPYNLAGMFQAASAIDQQTLDFPTIGWFSDDDDDNGDGHDLDDSEGSERLESIIEKSHVHLTHCAKRRKQQCDEMPYLVRTKSLTAGLAWFGSSTDEKRTGLPSEFFSESNSDLPSQHHPSCEADSTLCAHIEPSQPPSTSYFAESSTFFRTRSRETIL